MMTEPVKDNAARSRFELDVDGRTVFASYRRQGSTLYIPYVEAPPSLRGTGAAGRLMQGVMDIARAEKLTVVPICSYASLWIRRHREYHDLLG
jgi:predicted GNAT family acetyltransferase